MRKLPPGVTGGAARPSHHHENLPVRQEQVRPGTGIGGWRGVGWGKSPRWLILALDMPPSHHTTLGPY